MIKQSGEATDTKESSNWGSKQEGGKMNMHLCYWNKYYQEGKEVSFFAEVNIVESLESYVLSDLNDLVSLFIFPNWLIIPAEEF